MAGRFFLHFPLLDFDFELADPMVAAFLAQAEAGRFNAPGFFRVCVCERGVVEGAEAGRLRGPFFLGLSFLPGDICERGVAERADAGRLRGPPPRCFDGVEVSKWACLSLPMESSNDMLRSA